MRSLKKIQPEGEGIYSMTRKQAGEAYRAARAHKVKGDIAAWKRPKSRRGSK